MEITGSSCIGMMVRTIEYLGEVRYRISGPIHAVAGQGGETITGGHADKTAIVHVYQKGAMYTDKGVTPKPLPKGATRHKALPAACLDRMDDRAAFIGRWEQK